MTSFLIVEDDPNTMEAVTAMLEAIGHESVTTARDGQYGLERLNEQTPDLMLLDLMMPRIDGVELLRRLRDGAAPRPGHIIVMSAHANANDRQGVILLGADQFLAKPFTLDQLESALESAGISA